MDDTIWIKTVQQDLKSNNLSLNEAIDVVQNCPLWKLMSVFGALLMVHGRKEEVLLRAWRGAAF